MIAICALAGLVVNDSLILVDFVNRYRQTHRNLYRALLKAAAVRLRPILLTSITTIAGLMPTALGFGGKSVIWSPLAASLAWGLAFSTVLTLVVVPVFYVLIEDLTRFVTRIFNRKGLEIPPEESAESSVTNDRATVP
jgi:multidrug efflux pump subunit AcrB